MNLKIYFLLLTSVTLADNYYDAKTDSGYSLDQLSKFIVNEYAETFGDYAVQVAAVDKKKTLTTTMCLSILTTDEDEEPKVELKVDGKTKKADIPICLPESLKKWKREKGYGEVKEKKCGDQGNARKSNENIKPFILKEVNNGNNQYGFRSGNEKSIDNWEKLDKKLKDPSQPWSKFKRKDHPGNFDNQFREATDSLQKLMEAENKTSTFVSKAKFLRDNKNINEKVFERALKRTLFARSDTSNDAISPLETNVLSYVSGKMNGGDYVAGLEIGNNNKNFVISKDINPLEPGDPDHKLNYWREDILLHVFHQFWHEINHVAYPLNRKNERFTFSHNQLFQRYNIEREINGMSPITCETGEEFFKPFPRSYKPQLWISYYSERKKDCQLSQDTINKLKNMRSDLLSKIQPWKNDPEKYIELLERDYHNNGHNLQAIDCAGGNAQNPRSVMAFSEVAARDPTFYKWHCEIQRVWQKWLDVQPKYEKKDMDVDIELTKVWVETKDGNRNKLVTFMEDTTLEHKDKFTIKYHRLNHDPFNFKLTLKNTQKKAKKVMIRIFLGISRKGQTDEALYRARRKMIIMDRFIYTLEGHDSEEVTRASSASAATLKESGATLDQMIRKLTAREWTTTSFCGWPAHLFLPRGGRGGRQYDLAVVVTDVDQNNNEGIDGVDHIICGHNNPSATVDKRSFAFPFDRPWNFKLNDVKSVKIEKLTITHKNSVTSETSRIDIESQQEKDKQNAEQNAGENNKTSENPGENNKITENPGGNNNKVTENPDGNNDMTTENKVTTQANSQNEATCKYNCKGWPYEECEQKSSSGSSTCIPPMNSEGVTVSNYPMCAPLPQGCVIECNKHCEKNEEKQLTQGNPIPDCIENNTDYFGNDVVPYKQSPKVENWQQCSDLCRKNQQCKHWTWLKGHGKKCLVKSSNKGKRKRERDISGSRECGSKYQGNGQKYDYNEGTGECRARNNKKCQLPFIFQSVRYNGCIQLPTKSEGKTWCSTKNDDKGHVVKKYWGYCNQNCPTDPNGEKV